MADENAGLKTELARVQEASVGSRGAAREGVRVAELEGLVKDMEHEKKQLQVYVHCAMCYILEVCL